MNITTETRNEAKESIESKRTLRSELILNVLDGSEMTVSEIVKLFLDIGIISYYDRNFVAPRLTELKAAGRVKVVGKRRCIITGKNIAVWAVA